MESPANILEDLDAASEIPADIMASPTAASTAELALENEGQNECDDEPHFEELLSDSEADEVFKEQGDTLLIGEYNGLNNNEELNDESDGSVHIDDSEVEVLEEVSRIGPGLAYNREELAIELDSEEDIDNLESEAEGSTYREATNDELDGDEDLINKYSRSEGEVSSVQDDGAYAGAEDLPLSIVDIEDGSCSSPPDALEGRNGIAGDAEIAGETEIADDYIDEASENSADDVDQEIDNGIGWESDSDIDPEIENDIAKESDSDTDQEGDGHVDPQGCNDIDDEIDKGSDQEREVAGDDAGERSGFDSEDYARWEASGDGTKGPTVDSSDESVGGSQEPRVSLAQLDIPLVVQVDESRYLLQFQGKAPGCSLHGLKPLEHPSGTCGSVQQFLGFLLRLDEMQHGHGTAFLEVPELGLRMGQHSVHALQMDVEEILWCYQALLQNTAHGKHTHMLIRVSKGMDLGHQYELVRTLAKAGRGMDALETAMRKRRGGRLTAGPGPKKSRVGNEQTPPGTGIR